MKLLFTSSLLFLIAVSVMAQPGNNPDNQLARSLYVQACRYHLQTTANHASLFEISYVMEAYRNDPKLSLSNANAGLVSYRSTVKGKAPSSDYAYYRYLQDLVMQPGNLTPAQLSQISLSLSAASRPFYELYMKLVPDYRPRPDTVLYDFDRQFEERILSSAYELAQSQANFKTLFNGLFAGALGHNCDESATDVLAKDKDFTNSLSLGAILPKLQQHKLNDIDTSDIIQAFTGTLKKLSDASWKKMQPLQTAKDGGIKGEPIDDKTDPKSVTDLQLMAAGSSVSFLSDLCGVTNHAALGAQIYTIGNGCVDIGRSISQLTDITSKFSASGGYLLGSIVLSGNIFSAALNIFSAFHSGPSQQEIMMKELQGISTQIDTLYSVMNQRFDEIDWKLDTIYSTMTQDFTTVLNNLQDTRQVLETFGQTIGDIQQEMVFFNMMIVDKLNRIDTRPLNSNLAAVVDWSGNTNFNFEKTSDLFYDWAVRQSKDYSTTLENNYAQTNALNIYNDLLTQHDDLSFYFINEVLKAQYNRDLAGDILPDPDIWLKASNGILAMADKWPANKIEPSKLDQLIQTGQSLLNFQSNLKYDMEGGKIAHYNNQIIDAVLEDYRQHCLAFLKAEILPKETSYVQGHNKGVDPFHWRNSVDTVSYSNNDCPASLSMNTEPGYVHNFTDNRFLYKLLPNIYRFAQYFELVQPGFGLDVHALVVIPMKHELVHVHGNDETVVIIPAVYNIDSIYINAAETYTGAQPADHFSQGISLGNQVAFEFSRDQKVHDADRCFGLFYNNANNSTATVLNTMQPALQPAFQGDHHPVDSVVNAYFKPLRQPEYAYLLGLLNPGSTPTELSNKKTAELDYHYTLLKDIVAIAFPNSISGDDSLAGYFYGDRALLSSDNMNARLQNALSAINLGTNADVYIDWVKLTNDNVDALKAYIDKKLQLSLSSHDWEPIGPIDITIRNLYILKARQ